MFPGYLAKAANIFAEEVNVNKRQITKGLGEIEQLNYNEEDRLEMEKKIEELEGLVEISDENRGNQLGEGG